MGITKSQIESRLREAERECAELRVYLEQDDWPWEPEGGGWFLSPIGTVSERSSSYKAFSRLGLERSTEEGTELTLERMISSNLLQAYVYEYGGDWVADWNDETQTKHYIMYCFSEKDWWCSEARCLFVAGTVYMNEECAEKLRDDLNSGHVVTNERMNLVPVE